MSHLAYFEVNAYVLKEERKDLAQRWIETPQSPHKKRTIQGTFRWEKRYLTDDDDLELTEGISILTERQEDWYPYDRQSNWFWKTGGAEPQQPKGSDAYTKDLEADNLEKMEEYEISSPLSLARNIDSLLEQGRQGRTKTIQLPDGTLVEALLPSTIIGFAKLALQYFRFFGLSPTTDTGIRGPISKALKALMFYDQLRNSNFVDQTDYDYTEEWLKLEGNVKFVDLHGEHYKKSTVSFIGGNYDVWNSDKYSNDPTIKKYREFIFFTFYPAPEWTPFWHGIISHTPKVRNY